VDLCLVSGLLTVRQEEPKAAPPRCDERRLPRCDERRLFAFLDAAVKG